MNASDFKAWRDRHNLTQATLANRLGYGKRQIESYERGEADVPVVVELALQELSRRLDYEYRAAAREMHTNCS